MIIWINGAFGVGKTTCAAELHRKIEDSILYDPEKLGDFFQDFLPAEVCPQDFQDYELWRLATYQILHDLATKTNQIIIVPMTIIKTQCYKEIIQRLIEEDISVRHYVLTADKKTLVDRIKKRTEEEQNWSYQYLDSCLAFFKDAKTPGIKIKTDDRSVGEIVQEILNKS